MTLTMSTPYVMLFEACTLYLTKQCNLRRIEPLPRDTEPSFFLMHLIPIILTSGRVHSKINKNQDKTWLPTNDRSIITPAFLWRQWDGGGDNSNYEEQFLRKTRGWRILWGFVKRFNHGESCSIGLKAIQNFTFTTRKKFPLAFIKVSYNLCKYNRYVVTSQVYWLMWTDQ